MGYRLHAQLLNVKETIKVGEETHQVDTFLELGKQYDTIWDDFNDYWFGENQDNGAIHWEDLDEFFSQMKENNKKAKEYDLYNLEFLEKMIELAKEEGYSIYFCSF